MPVVTSHSLIVPLSSARCAEARVLPFGEKDTATTGISEGSRATGREVAVSYSQMPMLVATARH